MLDGKDIPPQLHHDTYNNNTQKCKLCIWLMFNMIIKASLMASNG